MDIVTVNPEKTLFVSGAIEDWELLREHRIHTIVDMDGTIDPGVPEIPNEVLYVYFPIQDDDLPDLHRLHSVGKLVANLTEGQQPVLVHCRMGLNRSVLVIATALTYLGMSGAEALAHLQALRPGALYNERFADYVRGLPAIR